MIGRKANKNLLKAMLFQIGLKKFLQDTWTHIFKSPKEITNNKANLSLNMVQIVELDLVYKINRFNMF